MSAAAVPLSTCIICVISSCYCNVIVLSSFVKIPRSAVSGLVYISGTQPTPLSYERAHSLDGVYQHFCVTAYSLIATVTVCEIYPGYVEVWSKVRSGFRTADWDCIIWLKLHKTSKSPFKSQPNLFTKFITQTCSYLFIFRVLLWRVENNSNHRSNAPK